VAAAALNAARKSLKHCVTTKNMGALSPVQQIGSRLAQQDGLLPHLSAASSPCLLQTPGGTHSLRKIAITKHASNIASTTGKTNSGGSGGEVFGMLEADPAAAAAAPAVLIKGGSVKIDEQQMTFLFSGGRAVAGLQGQPSYGKGL
jgi:hypothetical protein